MIVSLFLLILSLFTTYWLKTHSFHTGLLEECVDNVSGAGLQPLPFGPQPGKCQARSKHSSMFFLNKNCLLTIGLYVS